MDMDALTFASILDFENDPFPTSAPEDVTYWSDNQRVLSNLIDMQKQTLIFQSTSLNIFYGPKGTGKTFSASYLSNEKIKRLFLKVLNKGDLKLLTINLEVNLPLRPGTFINSFHFKLFHKLLEKIFEDKLGEAFKQVIDSTNLSSIKKHLLEIQEKLSDKDFEIAQNTTGYKYFTFKSNKKPEIESALEAIILLFNVLFSKYNKIALIIDEMENIRDLRLTDQLLINDYLKKIHDKVETNLNIILIYTFDSISDVQTSLSDALFSRVKKKIEFGYIREEKDLRDYVTECIKYRGKKNMNQIMEQDVLDKIIEDLKSKLGKINFREVNREIHLIFSSIAEKPLNENRKITLDVYNDATAGNVTNDRLLDLLKQVD